MRDIVEEFPDETPEISPAEQREIDQKKSEDRRQRIASNAEKALKLSDLQDYSGAAEYAFGAGWYMSRLAAEDRLNFPEIDASFLNNPFLREALSKGFIEGAKDTRQFERLVRLFEGYLKIRQETMKAVQDPRGLYARAYASSAGWYLSRYIRDLGLKHDPTGFEALRIDDRLLKNEELRKDFVAGFRDEVHSRYDEDEERFPGSDRSRKLDAEREEFCQSFAAHVAQKVAQLSRSREKVLHRIVRQSNQLRTVDPSKDLRSVRSRLESALWMDVSRMPSISLARMSML